MKAVITTLLACALLAGCAAGFNPPSRAPDALGTAAAIETADGVTSVLFEHDSGYEYFEGTTFVLDDEVDVGGKVTAASAIEVGDRIDVWTNECAESFPVQCQVEAVKVE